LRMAAAERNVWTAADLRRLLASKAHYELSAPSVAALMTREPTQVKLTTLAALCIALDCRPDDLLQLDHGQSALRPLARTSHEQGQVYRLHPRQPAYRHDQMQAPPARSLSGLLASHE
jgi:putative transcriptional regulator